MRLTLPFTKRKEPSKPGRAKVARASRQATKRRARARWMRPALRLGLPVFAAVALGAGGYFAVSGGHIARAADRSVAALVDATVSMGLAVNHVSVAGRRETGRDTLLAAMKVEIGDPILTVDLEAMADRIRALGWVADATVYRRLPGRLHVKVEERVAAAIWQHEGRFVLIDRDGAVIGPENLDRYRHLKVVVGEGAPERTDTLLSILAQEPTLESRVIAAVWISGRRWNLRLDNGIDIRLPEEDSAGAWRRLAQLERDHALLSRDIRAIDMRQSDKLIVRMTEEAAQRHRAHEDET